LKNRAVPVYVLGFLSLIFFALARFIPASRERNEIREMSRAAEIMDQASAVIHACTEEKHLRIDGKSDINLTGLVGLETSSTTTTLGNLEAKRTTTNSNFAGLLVHLFQLAGVRRGDTVAIGASGSFPALVVAVLSAARALDLRALLICSLGASQWGANEPEFGWIEMGACLNKAGLFRSSPLAYSLGGEGDGGQDMSPEGRAILSDKIKRTGVFFIDETDLMKNVRMRMKLYEEGAAGAPIRAFVNIGGSWANIGTDPSVLKLGPGLAGSASEVSPAKRGVLQEMALRRIPIIHLLHIRGIVQRYGLPWDPSPLPRPGKGDIYRLTGKSRPPFIVLAGIYFFFVIVVLFISKKHG
jgi:poly-gamma-glutamate system protein